MLTRAIILLCEYFVVLDFVEPHHTHLKCFTLHFWSTRGRQNTSTTELCASACAWISGAHQNKYLYGNTYVLYLFINLVNLHPKMEYSLLDSSELKVLD